MPRKVLSAEYERERLELAQVNKRRCHTCNEIKQLDTSFSLNPRGISGYQSRCKQCGYKVKNAKRRGRTPLAKALEAGYYRAVDKGLPAEWITEEELLAYWADHGVDPNICFYTGRKLGTGESAEYRFNLEHVKPLASEDSPGHVLENLVPACSGFNAYKSDERPAVAVLKAREEFRPEKRYEGPTDELGNPTAPGVVEKPQQVQRNLKRRGE